MLLSGLLGPWLTATLRRWRAQPQLELRCSLEPHPLSLQPQVHVLVRRCVAASHIPR